MTDGALGKTDVACRLGGRIRTLGPQACSRLVQGSTRVVKSNLRRGTLTGWFR